MGTILPIRASDGVKLAKLGKAGKTATRAEPTGAGTGASVGFRRALFRRGVDVDFETLFQRSANFRGAVGASGLRPKGNERLQRFDASRSGRRVKEFDPNVRDDSVSGASGGDANFALRDVNSGVRRDRVARRRGDRRFERFFGVVEPFLTGENASGADLREDASGGRFRRVRVGCVEFGERVGEELFRVGESGGVGERERSASDFSPSANGRRRGFFERGKLLFRFRRFAGFGEDFAEKLDRFVMSPMRRRLLDERENGATARRELFRAGERETTGRERAERFDFGGDLGASGANVGGGNFGEFGERVFVLAEFEVGADGGERDRLVVVLRSENGGGGERLLLTVDVENDFVGGNGRDFSFERRFFRRAVGVGRENANGVGASGGGNGADGGEERGAEAERER